MHNKLFYIFLITFAVIISCGKKEEMNTSVQEQKDTAGKNPLQQNNQPLQNPGGFGGNQQQVQSVNPDTEKKQEEKQLSKEEEKKLEQQKRLEEEKKKQKDPTKVVEIDQNQTVQNPQARQNQNTSADLDFTEIWKKRCVKCHGMNGKGKVEGVPDLTSSETKNKSLSQLISVIKNGKKSETEDGEDMPAFKNKLTEAEIEAAAKFVKGL